METNRWLGELQLRRIPTQTTLTSSPVGDPPAQLYNLDERPGEANNLYFKHRKIVPRLKVTLERIKADEYYNPTELEPPDTLTIE